MSKLTPILALALPCCSFWLAEQAARDLPRRVEAGGHLLRMRADGAGSPAVVFEIGLGGILDEWAAVVPEIAQTTRVVTYDRLGANYHRPILTGEEIARDLHTALETAGIPPPYILVGQSFGGIYIRLFASMFPDEVAGLVLVDPSQEDFIAWMNTHHPERDISRENMHDWPEGAGIRATLNQLKEAGPLPDVPTVIITGGRTGDDPLRIEVLPVWIASHAAWIKSRPQGRHVVTAHSGHGVHVEAPEIVIDTILDMVRAVVKTAGKDVSLRAKEYP